MSRCKSWGWSDNAHDVPMDGHYRDKVAQAGSIPAVRTSECRFESGVRDADYRETSARKVQPSVSYSSNRQDPQAWSIRLLARTPGSQLGKTGSIPVSTTMWRR